MQINFRPVRSQAPSTGARLLQQAGQNINAGFESVNNVVANEQERRQQNQQARVNTNTQNFLDSVSDVGSLDELERKRNNNAFGSQLDEFGNEINRKEVRGAVNEREQTLREQQRKQAEAAREQTKFLNNQQDRALKAQEKNSQDLRSELFRAASSGDRQAVNGLLEKASLQNEGDC